MKNIVIALNPSKDTEGKTDDGIIASIEILK